MFLKNTLVVRFVRFSRTLPHPEVEETEDRIGCRVPVFVWCDWTVFTRYVPACWWRQNQDFIEKPGSFPHSNQVVVVSEQNLSMSTSLWQHTNKNETSGNVMLLQICGLQKLTLVIHAIGSVLQQVRNHLNLLCFRTLSPSSALRHPIMIQKQLKN